MSSMKCPFCNGELVGTIGHPICRNQDCVMCDDPMPQDLLEELIRTRKALDMAITELKNFSEDKEFSIRTWQLSAKDKLEQIESITKGGDNE